MPPTMTDLLDDPVFRMYYKQIPAIPPSLAHGHPWMVWAVSHSDKWGRKYYETYREAWTKLVEVHRDERFRDVVVVSRRILFPPPARAVWSHGQAWCSRCRRPSEFRLRSPDHHALRDQPALTEDEPRRCYYCGIRQAAMPHYSGKGYTS